MQRMQYSAIGPLCALACAHFFNYTFGHFQTLFNHVHREFHFNRTIWEKYDIKMHEDVSWCAAIYAREKCET